MKSIILAIFIALTFAGFAGAFEWHKANQATVAWDAVDSLDGGAALPPGSTIKYQVYTKDADGIVAAIQEVDAVQATITFTTEGNFLVGIQAVRYADGSKVSESTINWSDTNGAMTPDPFGFTFYQNPATPPGLKVQ